MATYSPSQRTYSGKDRILKMTFSFWQKIFSTPLNERLTTFFNLKKWSTAKTQKESQFSLKLKTYLVALKKDLDDFDLPHSFITSQKIVLNPNPHYLKAQLEAEDKPYFRLLSRAYAPDEVLNIEPKTYKFTLELGDQSQDLEVEVKKGDTASSLFSRLKEVINNSKLNLQAEIINQKTSREKAPTPNTGTFLALSTPYEFSTTPIRVKETSGFLFKQLNFQEPIFRQTPLTQSYSLTTPQVFAPASFNTTAFDPRANLNWDLGHYDFTFTLGEDSYPVYLAVVDQDALDKLNLLSSDSSSLVQETSNWQDIVQNLGFSPGDIDSNTSWKTLKSALKDYLIFTPQTTYAQLFNKLGAKLEVLSQQKLKFQVKKQKGFYLLDKIYPFDYQYLHLKINNPKFQERFYFTDGTSSPLEKLGLKGTATPGVDSEFKISGTSFCLPSNLASFKEGKIGLELLQEQSGNVFFEVVADYNPLLNNLQKVVQSYNQLLDFLEQNSLVINPGLKEKLTSPLKEAKDLKVKTGLDVNLEGRLELQEETFQQQLLFNAEDLKTYLFQQPGIFSQLQKNSEEILTNLDSFLALRTSPNFFISGSLLEKKELIVSLFKNKV
ncbi:MAG: Uncharacterized protein XD41_1374 [Desulfonauticus sp. 38_4375]|nr:MAG: Uncharacterized protein XD41_1374 [Desulfonauticus sp. 38_4375]